jgi:hypothetical protein
MKKFPITLLIIIFFSACDKNDPGNVHSTTNNYRLYITNNRIVEMDYLVNDSIRNITKYYFSDTQVKVVYYGQDTTIQQKYILYKIGENGYAKSSIEYPETINVFSSDSVFMSRRHYLYNSMDQLIIIECEHRHPKDSTWFTLYQYSYNGENISNYFSEIPYSDCRSKTTYETSDITNKIDILNFTNGILGKTNSKLVTHVKNEKSGFCDPHSSWGNDYDITYTLDEQGYVIQSKETTKDYYESRYSDHSITNIVIKNYDIRFTDKN